MWSYNDLQSVNKIHGGLCGSFHMDIVRLGPTITSVRNNDNHSTMLEAHDIDWASALRVEFTTRGNDGSSSKPGSNSKFVLLGYLYE